MDNCYFFAPDHLKPVMLGLAEADEVVFGDENDRGALHTSCLAMVQFAKIGLSDSMKPWFDAQLDTTVAMASSIDYLLSFVSSQDAGRSVCLIRVPRKQKGRHHPLHGLGKTLSIAAVHHNACCC